MSINTMPVTGEARQPRAIIKLNGTIVPGWISWEVNSNSFYEADTYRVSFAISALPDVNGVSWFSEQTSTFVEILAGFLPNRDNQDPTELTSLIYGRVDEMNIDMTGTQIDLRGRDLTAAFIDTKLTADYTNQFTSTIATQIAKSQGIATGLITPTTTKPGIVYQPDQVLMWSGRSQWDLVCALARQEKFVCFMTYPQGLYWGPDPLPDTNPYVIQWTPAPVKNGVVQGPPVANVLSLNFSRSQTVAKGVTVTVSSANLTNGNAVVRSYPSAPRGIQPGKATPFGGVQPYPVTAEDGLSPQQCVDLAESIYHRLISHEMKLEARLPGDNLLFARQVLQVTGTGTAFDQIYYPRSVTRSMSRDEGYVMTVQAQNQSPEQPQ